MQLLQLLYEQFESMIPDIEEFKILGRCHWEIYTIVLPINPSASPEVYKQGRRRNRNIGTKYLGGALMDMLRQAERNGEEMHVTWQWRRPDDEDPHNADVRLVFRDTFAQVLIGYNNEITVYFQRRPNVAQMAALNRRHPLPPDLFEIVMQYLGYNWEQEGREVSGV